MQVYHTPVSQTHTNPPHSNLHTRKFAWGAPHEKIMHGDVPTHSPHKIFRFFHPQRKTCIFSLKFSCLPMHPNISLYIPMHLFCMKMCRNSQFTQIYMENLLSPRKNSTCSRPHTNCSHWYPSILTQNFVLLWVCETGVFYHK